MTSFIELSNKAFAIVDDEDFDIISPYVWYVVATGNKYYAYNSIVGGMHNFIVGYAFVDHVNGNGLDNRRINLRETNYSLNRANTSKSKNIKYSSIYKGVCWNKKSKKWVAKITRNWKTKYIGSFDDEEEAAKAYDRAALELFGEHARLNFSYEI